MNDPRPTSRIGQAALIFLTAVSFTGCATPDKMASVLPGTIGPGAPGTTDVHIERVFGPEHPAHYKHPV